MEFNLIIPLQGANLLRFPRGTLMQGFGENVELYAKNSVFKNGHPGIDLALPEGTPILAATDGIVEHVEEKTTGYGKRIILRSLPFKGEDGNDWIAKTIYGHLSKISAAEKQEVKAGEKIGEIGNTGFVISGNVIYWNNAPTAKGVHLHFGLQFFRWINGNAQYLAGKYGADNGFLGYIDPFLIGFNQSNNTNMLYGIDTEKNQWLYDYTIKLAISIADEKELAYLKEKGIIAGEPTEVDLTSYTIYRGATEERLKAFFNLK